MNNGWSWQTALHGQSYLTCEFLNRWPHGFFSRLCWPHAPEDLVAVIHPNAAVLRVKQVHGNRVLTALDLERLQTEGHPQVDSTAPYFPEADGVLSNQPGQSTWVCSADCTPALIADERTGQVAAVHAGWRGTAAKILPEAVQRLQEQGSRLTDLRVALGPAIAGEVYQVTTEVAAQVGLSVVAEATLDESAAIAADQITTALMQMPNPPLFADTTPGRVRLDVRQINVMQLQQMGLDRAQIAIAPHCTFQEPERFFSYRRDNQKKVQWSGIVSI